jgi:hypothetical protein
MAIIEVDGVRAIDGGRAAVPAGLSGRWTEIEKRPATWERHERRI